MKKVALMIFVVGMMGGITYGAEKKPYYGGVFGRKLGTHWTRPTTHIYRPLAEGEKVPKGYTELTADEKDLVRAQEMEPVIGSNFEKSTKELPLSSQVKRAAQKKLASGRHEYYNQFIEGYEPKEEFENKMLLRRPLVEAEKLNKRYPTYAERMRSAQEMKKNLLGDKSRMVPLVPPGEKELLEKIKSMGFQVYNKPYQMTADKGWWDNIKSWWYGK